MIGGLERSGGLSSDPEKAEEQHEEPCPGGVGPDLQAAFLHGGFGHGGDGGEDGGGGAGIEHFAFGEAGDFTHDIEACWLAAFFTAGALDGDLCFQG